MKKQLYTYNDPWELIDKWVFPRCFGCDSNAIYDQTIHLYRIDENSFGIWHHLRSGLTAVIAMYAAIFGMLAHLNVFWTIYGWIDIFWLLFCIFERKKYLHGSSSVFWHTSLTYLFIFRKYNEIYWLLNISVRELLVHIDNNVLRMYATFCRNTVICIHTTNYFCDITMKITFLISSFFHE